MFIYSILILYFNRRGEIKMLLRSVINSQSSKCFGCPKKSVISNRFRWPALTLLNYQATFD